MSKEFHVFTHHDKDYEQAFVFLVERHETEKIVEFKDLYMVTTTDHGELKTRIQIDQMIQSIVCNEGGNIDKNGISNIIDVFRELFPKEREVELYDELAMEEIQNINSEQLIKCSELIKRLEDEQLNEESNRKST